MARQLVRAIPFWLVLTSQASDGRLLFVQMMVDADPVTAALQLEIDCFGLFDTHANIHACATTNTMLPTAVAMKNSNVLCVGWKRADCGPLTSTIAPSPPPSTDPFADPVIAAQVMTFEECVASLPPGGKPKTLNRPVEWIHIPKCGTSFGATVYGYLCGATETPYTNPADPTENCTYCGEQAKGLNRGLYWDPKLRNMIPFSNMIRRDGTRHRFYKYHAPYCDWTQSPHPPYSNHFPLSDRANKQGTTAAVTMLREPRKRLVSAWNNDKHSYGIAKRDTVKYLQNITAFVQHSAIQGCQTKMLVGRVCADAREITDTNLQRAIAKLEKSISFFGLTDAFNASVCLFHHMHGGMPQPYMFETVGGLRSSSFLVSGYKKSKKYKPLPGGGERVPPETWHTIDPLADPMDSQLYSFARRLFIKRLRQHNIFKGTSAVN